MTKAIQEKGLTILPIKLYLKNGRVKVLIAVGKGKKHFDKREAIKKKEVDKKMRAAEKGNFND
jgi:SsrA-binding protein